MLNECASHRRTFHIFEHFICVCVGMCVVKIRFKVTWFVLSHFWHMPQNFFSSLLLLKIRFFSILLRKFVNRINKTKLLVIYKCVFILSRFIFQQEFLIDPQTQSIMETSRKPSCSLWPKLIIKQIVLIWW